ITINRDITLMAFDLPGCGKSDILAEYSMSIIGNKITNFINGLSFKTIYGIGHSLGGHLLGYINIVFDGVVLIGTPPLSSAKDFPDAFISNQETSHLVKMLSKHILSDDEATELVSHTGIDEDNYYFNTLVNFTRLTDGNFRTGCLSTLADVDQVSWLTKQKKVVMIHAINDGVINPNYLEKLITPNWFENKVHYVNSKHMSTLLVPEQIWGIISNAFDF
ncbi:MAG: hypothetical protein KIT69_20530, partial [Propionibacteriaceae bacterium]|nr:hypothetical protein [Propionibacteriaceae bacterium]